MKDIFLISSLLFSQFIFAQTKITVFQPSQPIPVNRVDSARFVDRNLVKWNYSLLARGVFLLNYEFYISDKFTGEAGVGLTYRDIVFEMMKEGNFLDYGTPVVHLCGEAGIRFYPKDFDNFEGIYLSPMVSYRSYSFEKATNNNTVSSGNVNGFKPGYNFLDFQFKFGFQYESLWNLDILGDFYVGFALRNATVSQLVEIQNNNNTTTYQPSTSTTMYPQPLCGFKLGIPF
ncbi:MAG: hypothetical protein HYU69_14600 [Bacteroidetes bacterium]|nr:hypothetical protein [Bacteroidota bacterium]